MHIIWSNPAEGLAKYVSTTAPYKNLVSYLQCHHYHLHPFPYVALASHHIFHKHCFDICLILGFPIYCNIYYGYSQVDLISILAILSHNKFIKIYKIGRIKCFNVCINTRYKTCNTLPPRCYIGYIIWAYISLITSPQPSSYSINREHDIHAFI